MSHRPTVTKSGFQLFYMEFQPTQEAWTKPEMYYLDRPQHYVNLDSTPQPLLL